MGCRAFFAIITLGYLSACASFGSDDETASIDTHYTLREGRQIQHAPPLPRETEILVDWHQDDGGTRTVLGFRGYDFGGDARYEMIQVLNKDGSVQATLFDFDGDGRVDRTDQATK